MKVSFNVVLNKEEVNAYKAFVKHASETLTEVLGGDAPSLNFEDFFKDTEVKVESTSLFGKVLFAFNMADTIEYNVSMDLGSESFKRWLEIQRAVFDLVKFWPQIKPIVDQIKVIFGMISKYEEDSNPTEINVYTNIDGQEVVESIAAKKLNEALS